VQDGWTELGVECSVEELESAGFKVDVRLLAAARTTWVSSVVSDNNDDNQAEQGICCLHSLV
jgi:hypothetical protein